MKNLIINADDFGYSKVFNSRILELIEKEFLASTSVMIKWVDEEQKEQIEKLKQLHNDLDISVGLHFEFENEEFKKQIDEQFERFVEVFGFEPDHIDIHKTTYLHNGYPEIMKYSAKTGIPCKNHEVTGVEGAVMTEDPIYDATGKDIEEIKDWLSNLENGKTYLIQFHPGTYDPDSKSSFNEVREVDAKNIELINEVFEELNITQIPFKRLKK